MPCTLTDLYFLLWLFWNRFPGTGSFTRLSNKVDIGSSLLSILKERYVKVGKDQGDIYIDDKKVEMYDFDRVQERQR